MKMTASLHERSFSFRSPGKTTNKGNSSKCNNSSSWFGNQKQPIPQLRKTPLSDDE
jgi:hypothetical protein